jgi:uncharacterized Tic20 family protein
MARDDYDDNDREDEEDEGDSKSSKKKNGKLTDDDKLWGMLAHLSPLIGLGIIGPLIVMIMYKDKSKFVARHATEALNFDITMLIISLVTCGFGLIVAAPMSLIFHIIAGLAANKGEEYQYPMTIRMVK